VADLTPPGFSSGPRPLTRHQRLAVVDSIVARLLEAHRDRVVAIGLYGSTGRGADAPYSDIEMFCVIDRPGEDHRYEWIHGDGKAEVELFGEDVVRGKAAMVEGIGKVRNAIASGDFVKLASRACRIALMSALLLGLARRKV
jgi:hypothetical protein